MKRLFIILVALFMFANVSFAQKQETFFGVKFGASEQEVIDAFKKHGLVFEKEEIQDGDTLLLFRAEKKEYINYLKYDWNDVAVQFSDSKLGYIVFSRFFDRKDQAFNRYVEVNSIGLKKYEMVEVIRDTEDVIARCIAETEDLIVCFDCINYGYDYGYGVVLIYVNKDIMFNQDKEDEELVIQTIQDELPPPPPDMDKYLDEDGNILPQYLDEDGIFIPQVEFVYEEDKEEAETTIFTVIEESAMFPGGQEELMKYISENLRYPQQAREEGTQGLVFVTFVVEKDGSLTDIRILRDLGNGCGEEAVRIVKTMPKWIPAKKRGKAVRMQFNLPIKFTLAG